MPKETALSVAPSLIRREPDLVPLHKRAVLKALRWAWGELIRRGDVRLQKGDEESITFAMQTVLNECVEGERAAIWLQEFENVSRGERQATADWRINKQPDLCFRPIRYREVTNSTGWGWFVECKILSDRHSLADYLKHGVRRFVDGEYAVAMPSAAMAAYVRDGGQPLDRLLPALSGAFGTISVSMEASPDQVVSVHHRSVIGMEPICIAHLWLQCDRMPAALP